MLPSPLAGYSSRIPNLKLSGRMSDPNTLDSLTYILLRYRELSPSFAFRDDPTWKPAAKERLIERLGLANVEKVPLHAQISEPIQRPGYTRRTVVFATREGMDAIGYFLVPDNTKGPVPVVICLPGHGRGIDDLVGLDEKGQPRDHHDGYQHDFAIQCVEHGYASFALELLGFGHRRDPSARKAGDSASSCQPASGAALLLGETMAGWRAWDTMRSIDFLETRPEIDAKRIAVMGISGGGTVALYAAALDERVKAAVLSCSFCTYKDSIFSISHCIDNYVPGLLRDFEMADVASLIAPRYLFCEAGSKDDIFPKEGVKAALAQVSKAYAARGAADHVDSEIFEGGHLFHGKGAFEKLGVWL